MLKLKKKKKKDRNCQWSLLTCQINLFSFSSVQISHCSFLLKGGIYRGQRAHNEGERSHFVIASKPTFQKVTGGNLLLAPCDYYHETENNQVLCTYLPCELTSFATYIPWEKAGKTKLQVNIISQDGTPTTLMEGNLRLSENGNAKKWELMFHVISLLLQHCQGAKRRKRLRKIPYCKITTGG